MSVPEQDNRRRVNLFDSPKEARFMQRFAFIIHPLKGRDFARKFPLLGKVPETLLESLLRRVSPFKVSHIQGIESITGKQAEGWFIGCPLTARQMVELPEEEVVEKVIKAGKKAEELGVPLVGLGAFTAIVGDAGVRVQEALNIAVTTGNSYTVATALEGIEYAAEVLEQDLGNPSFAVLAA